jgi:AraC-like DNA-binding protein
VAVTEAVGSSADCPQVHLGHAKQSRFAVPAGRMTLAAAVGGCVRYTCGTCTVVLNDDVYLLLDGQLPVECSIRSTRPVELLHIYFSREMLAEAGRVLGLADATALPGAATSSPCDEDLFAGLLRHDRIVSPVISYIRSCIRSGAAHRAWLDEQLHYLLGRVLLREQRLAERLPSDESPSLSERMALCRRAARVAGFIGSSLQKPCVLRELMKIAGFSDKAQLLRVFNALYGVTPGKYREQKMAAQRPRRVERCSSPHALQPTQSFPGCVAI